MHRAALEGVVVILAVRRGAVDQRGAERVEAAGVAERRARAAAIARGERGGDVGLAPRRDAQPGDVHEEMTRRLHGAGGKIFRPRPAQPRSEDVCNRQCPTPI